MDEAPAEVDVAVVGAGVVGAATAWALAGEGLRVAVLEQFEVGHPRGSSHGSSRIFRLVYAEPHWIALARESRELWHEAGSAASETLLEPTGSLDIAADLEAERRALDAEGLAWETPGPIELQRRFPLLRPPDADVLLQPDGGIVHAERAVRALLRVAAERGVQVLERTRALRLEPGDGVEILTNAGAIRAQAAVVCAGAWSRLLLAQAGIDLPVSPTRETVAYFRLPAGTRLPTVIDYSETSWREARLPRPGLAAFALAAPGVGLKVGLHQTGVPADPDEPGEADGETLRAATAWAARRFALPDPEPVRAETCLYTNTEDERFCLDRYGPIVVGSACSGHGFKFAPAVGRRLADLARSALV